LLACLSLEFWTGRCGFKRACRDNNVREACPKQSPDVKEAWAMSSNLLDYPEENGLKSSESEGRNKERYGEHRQIPGGQRF
jgi:hypothetical protein